MFTRLVHHDMSAKATRRRRLPCTHILICLHNLAHLRKNVIVTATDQSDSIAIHVLSAQAVGITKHDAA